MKTNSMTARPEPSRRKFLRRCCTIRMAGFYQTGPDRCKLLHLNERHADRAVIHAVVAIRSGDDRTRNIKHILRHHAAIAVLRGIGLVAELVVVTSIQHPQRLDMILEADVGNDPTWA